MSAFERNPIARSTRGLAIALATKRKSATSRARRPPHGQQTAAGVKAEDSSAWTVSAAWERLRHSGSRSTALLLQRDKAVVVVGRPLRPGPADHIAPRDSFVNGRPCCETATTGPLHSSTPAADLDRGPGLYCPGASCCFQRRRVGRAATPAAPSRLSSSVIPSSLIVNRGKRSGSHAAVATAATCDICTPKLPLDSCACWEASAITQVTACGEQWTEKCR